MNVEESLKKVNSFFNKTNIENYREYIKLTNKLAKNEKFLNESNGKLLPVWLSLAEFYSDPEVLSHLYDT
jgi:hypothetical protein